MNLDEKLKNAKEGETILLTEKEKENFIEASEKAMLKSHEEREKFLFLIWGILMGLFGSFAVNLYFLYFKDTYFFKWNSILAILVFLLLMIVGFLKYKDYTNSINSFAETRKMWDKAKGITVGKRFKPKFE